MTVPATARRAGPFAGNGVATSFPFTFKVFSDEDIQVVFTATDGVETTLVLDSDYSVTLNPDQDETPGGAVTYPISGDELAAGESLTVVGDLPYDQTLDLPGGGAFSPRSLENALDRMTMQIQQLAENADRTLQLPVSVDGVDITLPAPSADKIIGWNSAATGLVNRDIADVASVIAYGTNTTELFDGDGTTTAFALAADPGSINNLDVSISGVVQSAVKDFALSGTTLTFTGAPPTGTQNITVRYGQALPVGVVDWADVRSKAVVYASDFGGNTADDTLEMEGALAAAVGKTLVIPAGWTFTCGPLTIASAMTLRVDGTLKMRDTSGVLLTVSADDATLCGDGLIDLNSTQNKGVYWTGDRGHIYGLTFANMLGGPATSGSSSALSVATCSHPRIHDLKFKNIQKGTAPSPYVSQPRAMSFDYVDGMQLSDVLCEDVYCGAGIGAVTKSEIHGLVIYCPTLTLVDNGLYIITSSDVLLSDVRIKDWVGEAIVVSGGNRITFQGGEVLDWSANAAFGFENTQNLTVDGMRFRSFDMTNVLKSRPANTSSAGINLSNLKIAVGGEDEDIIAFYNGDVNQFTLTNSLISGAVDSTTDFNNRFLRLTSTDWFVISNNVWVLQESSAGVAAATDWTLTLAATAPSKFANNTFVNQTDNAKFRVIGLDSDLVSVESQAADPATFGAVGNSVADDAAKWQNCIDSGAAVIDGAGRTYKISSELVGRANLTIQNATFTAPALPSNKAIIRFTGTDGTPQTLASNYAEGVFGMTVPNGAAFTVGGWAYLSSDEDWSTSDGVTYGELVQIASVTGNALTFGQSTLLAYATAANAQITPISMMSNVTLRNVRVIPPVSTGNQYGLYFDRCSDVVLDGVHSENADHTHFAFSRSARCTVNGGSASKTGVQEGLDYGVMVTSGCYDVLVQGLRVDAVRHLITIGGSDGVSRHIRAINNVGHNLTDAGMDSHSAVHEHTFSGNTLHFSDDVDTTIDGMLISGTAPIITGNHIYNCKRNGIFWQPEHLTTFGGTVSAIFANNRIDAPRDTTTSAAVAVQPVAVANLRYVDAVTIADNHIRGFFRGARVISNGAEIRSVRIAGFQCLRGLRASAVSIEAANGDIDGVDIDGGELILADAATAAVVQLVGTSPSFVKNWRIRGAHIKRGSGGTGGVTLTRTTTGFASGNVWDNITTRYTIDGASTGYVLDNHYAGTGTPEGAVTAIVGSTYRRTDGGASTTLYIKESGTGNTGWVAK